MHVSRPFSIDFNRRIWDGGEDLEVKLKDYLDGATVLFDAAGNVVDGRLQGDSSPWVISPRGVEVSFTWSDLSNKK